MRRILVVLLVVALSACVTTKKSNFTKNISIEKEVESRVQVALSYLQQDQPERSIFHLKEALDKAPKSARVYEVLGLALWQTGEHTQARKHFNKMKKYDKAYTRGRMNYASFLLDINDQKEARKELEFVVSDIYYPQRASAFFMLAGVYQKLSQFKDMEHAYERALKLDKRMSAPYLELADYRYGVGEFAESYALLKEYRSKVKQSPPRALLLGIKLAHQFNDKNEAGSFALALKNLYPRSKEYLEYLEMQKRR